MGASLGSPGVLGLWSAALETPAALGLTLDVGEALNGPLPRYPSAVRIYVSSRSTVFA